MSAEEDRIVEYLTSQVHTFIMRGEAVALAADLVKFMMVETEPVWSFEYAEVTYPLTSKYTKSMTTRINNRSAGMYNRTAQTKVRRVAESLAMLAEINRLRATSVTNSERV